MNDYEQCVRKNDNKPGKILHYLCWAIVGVSAVTGVIALLMLLKGGLVQGVFQLTASLAAFIVCFFLRDRWLLEYDYSYYDQTISIAKIFNEKSRKEYLQIPLSEIECIAPVFDDRFARFSAAPELKLYRAHFRDEQQCYFVYFKHQGASCMLLWEPKEALLRCIRSDKSSVVRV